MFLSTKRPKLLVNTAHNKNTMLFLKIIRKEKIHMKLKGNTPLLIISLLTLLASPVVLAGDDADGQGKGEGEPTNGKTIGDTQTATIVIPEVSLIDVTGAVTAKLEPPKNAGDNFEKIILNPRETNYDISANVAAVNPTSKKIVATSTNIPPGWKFDINMKPPSASGESEGLVSLTNAITSVDTVTGIKNVANKNLGMEIQIGPETPNIMPSYTKEDGYDVTIVYTITAE